MKEDSLKGLLAIIKQKLVMIVSFGILGLLITSAYTFFIVTPMYESTTQLLVNRASGDASNGIQLNDISSNVQMINTYKDIIKGPAILGEVKEQLELDYTLERLAGMVEIGANEDSLVFSLTIRGPKADESAEIANEIAVTFQRELVEIMNVENVSIISTAAIKSKPISPVILNNLLVGLLLGIITGAGVAFLQYAMVNTIDDYQFVTQTIGWPNLGTISVLNKEERTAITEMKKGELAGAHSDTLEGNVTAEKRIPYEEKSPDKEQPAPAVKREVKKQQRDASAQSGKSREQLITVSEMTREKIGVILQNESSRAVETGNKRGKQ